MKKNVLVISCLLLVQFFSWAVFTFTLNTHSFDFGNVALGDSKFGVPADNLKVTCRSDQGSPWTLQVKGGGDLSSGLFSIPLQNLKWFGTYTSGSSSELITEATSLQTVDRTVYRSDASGDNSLSGGTAVYMQFGITIPDTQPEGTYTTSVVVTMTE